MNDKKNLGSFGEHIASKYLTDHGYQVLQKNFHTRMGEIDIVAQEGKTLAFVEVKTRVGRDFGLPEEAITPFKIHHLIKTGEYYKMTHPNTPDALRIDCLAVEFSPSGETWDVRLTKNITG